MKYTQLKFNTNFTKDVKGGGTELEGRWVRLDFRRE